MKDKNQWKLVLGALLAISIGCNVVQYCGQRGNTDSLSLSYEEFTAFFQEFDDSFHLNGYKNLGGNGSPQIVYIDEECSFGKRNYLTLDDTQSTLQTQKRIEFAKDDGSELAVIDFIYLDTPLYEDLLY